MKINFALVGLAAAQSGDAKDYEYNYPSAWVFKYFFDFKIPGFISLFDCTKDCLRKTMVNILIIVLIKSDAPQATVLN